MDWTKTGYSYEVFVNVVSQTDVNNTLGALNNVKRSGLTITENYNSDSRVQGKVVTVTREGQSDGYVAQARLRIILVIPERNWHEELMTGYVSNIDEQNQNGYIQRTYTIEGTIWGLLEHKIKSPILIGKGSKMIHIWCTLLRNLTRMQYSAADAVDHSFNNNVVYEAGSNLSTVLFELTSGYDRMDVDGHGVVTLKKYTKPSARTASKVLDYRDWDGLTKYPLNRKSSEWERPGRAIVTANVSTTDSNGKTKQQVIVGSYDAPSSHDTSMAKRGYLRARTDSYSGTSERPSVSELNAQAKKNWSRVQDKGIEWSAMTTFADYHAGDVITLITPGDYSGGNPKGRKVLVQSVQTNLDQFTQQLTLKEV